MMCALRITDELIQAARTDLRRPHPFAGERIGFFHARAADAGAEGWLILPFIYQAVPDHQYLRDHSVGARINGTAIRSQMERALSPGLSVIHVHLHDHRGRPAFSGTDRRGHGPLLSALQNAGPDVPHAAMVLSDDSAAAVVLLPKQQELQVATKVTVLGRPMRLLGVEGELYG